MSNKILSLKFKEKNLLAITLEGDEGPIKYTVSESAYRKIGSPLSGDYVEDDELIIIAKEDESRRAMRKALSLLLYADNNERGLYIKLTRAGFSPTCARDTVCECVRLGYVNEERQIERIIERCKESLLGPRKILQKLLSRGYAKERVYSIMTRLEESGEIDFSEMRKELLSRLGDGASFEEKKKILYKYGYKV